MKEIVGKKCQGTTIVGVGSALVDILLKESDDFLTVTPGNKGGMTFVTNTDIDSIVRQSNQKSVRAPGGSACNTIVGIARLGHKARFIGKRGDDELGTLFEEQLHQNHVEPLLMKSATPTGRVLSVITPDAQRTMFTYLGAASETHPNELHEGHLHDAALLYLEGYLLFNEALLLKIVELGKRAGVAICLDLSSYTVVLAAKKILQDIIPEYIDIVLANEDEAKAYTGHSDEHRSLDALAKDVSVAVVKLGSRGSLIRHKGTTTAISRVGDGGAIDTTGAGDLWASGFIYGLVNNLSLQQAGNLASLCGYEVCQVVGAHIPNEGWHRIRAHL